MPKDRIEETLTAISEDWFLGFAGRHYELALRKEIEKLGQPKKTEIDSAMSLGGYWFHTQSQKRLRHGRRAYLLANYVFKPVTILQTQTLKQRCSNWNMETLRRGFKSSFPCFLGDQLRYTWAPGSLTRVTDPSISALLRPRDWTNAVVPDYKFIIHSMTEGHEGNLITDPEATMRQWDAISASVISNEKPNAYDRFGLILKLSQYNILTTSGADQWFDNYIGTTRSTKNPLGNVHPNSVQAKGMLAKHIGRFTLGIGALLTPDQVLEYTAKWDNRTRTYVSPEGHLTRHNEITITGKGYVAIGGGYSQPLEVEGIFILINKDGSYYSKTQGNVVRELIRPALQDNTILRLETLSRTKSLPILYLPVT